MTTYVLTLNASDQQHQLWPFSTKCCRLTLRCRVIRANIRITINLLVPETREFLRCISAADCVGPRSVDIKSFVFGSEKNYFKLVQRIMQYCMSWPFKMIEGR